MILVLTLKNTVYNRGLLLFAFLLWFLLIFLLSSQPLLTKTARSAVVYFSLR